MKPYLLLLMLFLLHTVHASAVRAYPHPKTVQQSDGTTLTIIGHGDEFQNYVTTTDGYTVVKGSDGIYRYASLRDGKLIPTMLKAKNVDDREASDSDFLFNVSRNLKPDVSGTGRKLMKMASKADAPLQKIMVKSPKRAAAGGIQSNLDNYRGLVILVNFTDRKFSRGDNARQLVDDMMNKEGYAGYEDIVLNGFVECTGSVRDYFADNSNGMFAPQFDVVGPVEVDVDQYYINGTDRTYELCGKVLESADADIDYSRYDADGDGMVDMLYVIYAGYASVYQDNDTRLVWPHAGHFQDSGIDLYLDGMNFGRFACSSEIFGWHDDGDLFLDGIGVIVHEFSHVLGFKDHYDVSGFLNEDPGTWDVMASGNYNGVLNDTPCGYNSYEKFAAGFISPRTVTCENDGEVVSLRSLAASNEAIRIKSTQDSTVFLMENRQLEKWDKYLPGHGMLVWRVDSCDREYWDLNALNVNGSLHFKLIRALGPTINLFREIEDTDYDPFPGSRNVSDLTNFTSESNLLTDKKYPSPMALREIEEHDGVVTFRLEEDAEASPNPYTFALREHYDGSGDSIGEEATEIRWEVATGTIQSGGRDRQVIYNLIPDTRNIGFSDPKYADGLYVPYAMSGDKKSVIIEPTRVAMIDDYGVWLVDFNDLDNGGSGAIVLTMNPYGDISPANSECVLGFCYMDNKSFVVVPEKIIERFSMVKNIRFDAPSGIESIIEASIDKINGEIYNLQGMRVSEPKKGEIYIVNGKKLRF